MLTTAEWSARIHCKVSEVGGPFSIFIFLGDVPTNPSQWLNDPAFVGTFDVYSNDDGGRHDFVVHGPVHLSGAILDQSRQTSLDADVVVPFLKRQLNWAVQGVRQLAVIFFWLI